MFQLDFCFVAHELYQLLFRLAQSLIRAQANNIRIVISRNAYGLLASMLA